MTDYGNSDEIPEVELRNRQVPVGIRELEIHYGCSFAEFFRGSFEGTIEEAKAVLEKVRTLTVYESKAGGPCKLEDHLSRFVFHEDSVGNVYFFDINEQPRDWEQEVGWLLPEELHDLPPNYPNNKNQID